MSQALRERCDVCIILLSLNQMGKTLRCLQSLNETDTASWSVQILLWDNGSTDGTAAAAQEQFPNVYVHQSAQNLGVAGGRNRAAGVAIDHWDCRYLLFLDNDMIVESDLINQLMVPFDGDPQVAQTTGKIKVLGEPERLFGAMGCKIVFWRGETHHIGYGTIDRGQYDTIASCIPSGGCMFIRRDVFQQLSGFDEGYNPYGPEDLDLGLRIKEAGYKAIYVPTAVVYHEMHPSRTASGGTYNQAYAANKTKHWFRFMGRHASRMEKIAFYLIGAPYLLIRLMIREGQQGNLWPALRGLLAGFVSRFT